MKLYANLENMSYRVSLLFQSEVVFHRSGKVTLRVCLDEDKLITIISMIPVLRRYRRLKATQTPRLNCSARTNACSLCCLQLTSPHARLHCHFSSVRRCHQQG
jgi:hypothetical protein